MRRGEHRPRHLRRDKPTGDAANRRAQDQPRPCTHSWPRERRRLRRGSHPQLLQEQHRRPDVVATFSQPCRRERVRQPRTAISAARARQPRPGSGGQWTVVWRPEIFGPRRMQPARSAVHRSTRVYAFHFPRRKAVRSATPDVRLLAVFLPRRFDRSKALQPFNHAASSAHRLRRAQDRGRSQSYGSSATRSTSARNASRRDARHCRLSVSWSQR